MKSLKIAGVLLLTGCVSGQVNYLHKSGSSAAQRQLALDQCRIEAAQAVPAQSRTIYQPGVHTPGTTYCNSIGSSTTCNTYGGLNIPASIDTVDDNEGLRSRTVERCLQSKGYTLAVLPICQGKKDYEGDVQPPLSQITCATPRLQN